eukprot:752516-Hanusia_phi.AAC.2
MTRSFVARSESDRITSPGCQRSSFAPRLIARHGRASQGFKGLPQCSASPGRRNLVSRSQVSGPRASDVLWQSQPTDP